MYPCTRMYFLILTRAVSLVGDASYKVKILQQLSLLYGLGGYLSVFPSFYVMSEVRSSLSTLRKDLDWCLNSGQRKGASRLN